MASGLQKATFTKDLLPKSIPLDIGNVQISMGTPAIITLAKHGLNTGDMFYLSMGSILGNLPNGLSTDTKYFVAPSVPVSINTFQIAPSYEESVKADGIRINTTGIQVGTVVLRCSIFYVRYRVISKDKNRYSHWSPIYHIVDPNPTSLLPGTSIDGGTV